MAVSKYNTLSDTELVNEFKKTGDNTYVGVLFERYTHLVFGVCMKYFKDEEESKDGLMQIFEKLLTDIKKHEITYFKGWLHSVAKNYCLMHIRSQQSLDKKQVEMEKDLQVSVELDDGLHHNNGYAKEEQLNKLEESINKLNDEQKTCIELFYLQNKCYQEVADITGFSLNQVKSYIQNGKRNLKIFLTETTNE